MNVITTPGARNYSEMAHMFQVTLGNVPAFNTSGGASAWKFLMGEGEQIGDTRYVEFFAWAVHDGDVGYK
jgi:hypothetical protein